MASYWWLQKRYSIPAVKEGLGSSISEPVGGLPQSAERLAAKPAAVGQRLPHEASSTAASVLLFEMLNIPARHILLEPWRPTQMG